MPTTLKATTVEIVLSAEGTGVEQEITTRADTSGIKAHTFSSDNYAALGGADSAPSPLVYALGALSACTQMTGKIVADELDLSLGRWTMEVSGDLDTSVLVEGGDGSPTFSAVRLDVRVESDADDEQFRHLQEETERRCPLTVLFVRDGLDLQTTWSRAELASG